MPFSAAHQADRVQGRYVHGLGGGERAGKDVEDTWPASGMPGAVSRDTGWWMQDLTSAKARVAVGRYPHIPGGRPCLP